MCKIGDINTYGNIKGAVMFIAPYNYEDMG